MATKKTQPTTDKKAVPLAENPIYGVSRLFIGEIQANDYNPNSQQTNEIELLYKSIFEDGYTQPLVVAFNHESKKYIIVDGFHRYRVMREYKDIYEANEGMLPVVVIKKTINELMASTVRHNRARGKHSSKGMLNIVSQMLKNGATGEQIQLALGMSQEEYKRLIITTGVLSQYENVDYSKSWLTKKQILIKTAYAKKA